MNNSKISDADRRTPDYYEMLCILWSRKFDLNKVRGLIEKMPTLVNLQEPDWGYAPLHVAAAAGSVEGCRYLLEKGASTELCVGWSTALHLAAKNGCQEVVAELLKAGASSAARAMEDETPLHLAATSGHIEVVRLLLQHGADVAALDRDGLTALVLASAAGHREIVDLLARAIHPEIPVKGLRLTHQTMADAAEKGDLNDVKNHFLSGSDLNSVDESGLSPLFYAVIAGQTEVVRFMIENGALINGRDQQGDTPLDYAVLMARDIGNDIVAMLEKVGASSGKCRREEKRTS